MTEMIAYFATSWTDPYLLMLTALGTLAGIYVGAIPGLSVTMATSILISFTFKWDVNAALALIGGVFVGGVYGGGRTAILLNIPGAPSAIATAIDGFPLAKKGLAGEAIGLSTVMSVIGGLIGVLALALAAPLISDIALKFTSRDYMLLGIIGILLVGALSGESFAKGAFAGALGVLIGMVGLDPMTAETRFTYGSIDLMGGVPYVVAMIGFSALPKHSFNWSMSAQRPSSRLSPGSYPLGETCGATSRSAFARLALAPSSVRCRAPAVTSPPFSPMTTPSGVRKIPKHLSVRGRKRG